MQKSTPKQIKILKTIIAEETIIGEGVIYIIENGSEPIIKLLRRSYKDDPNCITGDIDYLFSYEPKGNSEDFYL